jgi:hypothetical protein
MGSGSGFDAPLSTRVCLIVLPLGMVVDCWMTLTSSRVSNLHLAPLCSLKKREVYFVPMSLGINRTSVIFLINQFLSWGVSMRKVMTTLGKTTTMVGSEIMEN